MVTHCQNTCLQEIPVKSYSWEPLLLDQGSWASKGSWYGQGNENPDWAGWGKQRWPRERETWSRSTWTNRNCKPDWWMRLGKEKTAVQFSWQNAAAEKETLHFPGRENLARSWAGHLHQTLTGAHKALNFSGLVLNTVSWSGDHVSTQSYSQRQWELPLNPYIMQNILKSKLADFFLMLLRVSPLNRQIGILLSPHFRGSLKKF